MQDSESAKPGEIMPDILYAALAAANIHYAANIQAIERGASDGKPALVAAETARHKREMATLGCSSVPPCGLAKADDAGRCAPQPAGDHRLVPSGAAVNLEGAAWIAQSRDPVRDDGRGVILDADGSVTLAAASGERPWFDPPRKIRAEFCGIQRFPKGVPIALDFDLLVAEGTTIAGLDWASIAQIHGADMHYADGAFVEASPLFGIGLKGDAAGDVLVVSADTAAAPLRTPVLDARGQQAVGPEGPRWNKHFAPSRLLAQSPPLARGAWHHVAFRVVDGHGGPGSVKVSVDGTTLVDRPSLPTGYSYGDDLADVPYAGGPQDAGSYLKFGIYGGRFEGDITPAAASVSLRYRNVKVAAP